MPGQDTNIENLIFNSNPIEENNSTPSETKIEIILQTLTNQSTLQYTDDALLLQKDKRTRRGPILYTPSSYHGY